MYDENSDISKEAGKRNNISNAKSYVLVIVFITPTTNTVTFDAVMKSSGMCEFNSIVLHGVLNGTKNKRKSWEIFGISFAKYPK
jgi:hypothetical protein